MPQHATGVPSQPSSAEAESSGTTRNATAPLTVLDPTPLHGTDDNSIVASAKVLATGALPVTRVMSPNVNWTGGESVRRAPGVDIS